jgi:hypothetical protein
MNVALQTAEIDLAALHAEGKMNRYVTCAEIKVFNRRFVFSRSPARRRRSNSSDSSR